MENVSDVLYMRSPIKNLFLFKAQGEILQENGCDKRNDLFVWDAYDVWEMHEICF